jgi:hypothetical protein
VTGRVAPALPGLRRGDRRAHGATGDEQDERDSAAAVGARAETARATGVSSGVVSKTESRARLAGMDWAAVEGADDEQLERRLYGGPKHLRGPARPSPDALWMHAELRRPGGSGKQPGLRGSPRSFNHDHVARARLFPRGATGGSSPASQFSTASDHRGAKRARAPEPRLVAVTRRPATSRSPSQDPHPDLSW